MMQNWVGIRASGALAILGSLLAFLSTGALLWTSVGMAHPPGESAR